MYATESEVSQIQGDKYHVFSLICGYTVLHKFINLYVYIGHENESKTPGINIKNK